MSHELTWIAFLFLIGLLIREAGVALFRADGFQWVNKDHKLLAYMEGYSGKLTFLQKLRLEFYWYLSGKPTNHRPHP